jgi:hypothetical protein
MKGNIKAGYYSLAVCTINKYIPKIEDSVFQAVF